LARRLMTQPAASREVNKEILVTFSAEDVPRVGASEPLFYLSPFRQDGIELTSSEAPAVVNPPRSDERE
jgi:hypothetical protein